MVTKFQKKKDESGSAMPRNQPSIFDEELLTPFVQPYNVDNKGNDDCN